MKKIIIIIMEKKISVQKPFLGYCPNYIVKKKNLYCKTESVLQEVGGLRDFVLQYKNCIAEKKA